VFSLSKDVLRSEFAVVEFNKNVYDLDVGMYTRLQLSYYLQQDFVFLCHIISIERSSLDFHKYESSAWLWLDNAVDK
jgi:hypothetical protein